MSMGDMSPEALERIVRIETKLDMLVEMIPKMQELQVAHESAKSAHHRIDNIYKIAGLISTIVSVVIALIGKVL